MSNMIFVVIMAIIGAAVFVGLYFGMLKLIEPIDARIKEEQDEDELPLLDNDYLTRNPMKAKVLFGILGAVIGAGLTFYYGMNLVMITVFALFCVLTMITFIDIARMEIPVILNILIGVIGLISIFTMPGISIMSRIIAMFVISVPMLIIVFIVPGGFGGGDIKMMFAAGLFFGIKAVVAGFFVGLVLGGLYGILLLVMRRKGRKEHFAFGPFLAVGLGVAVFAGNYLMNLYLSTMF